MDIDALGRALQYLSTALDALDIARDSLSDEYWEGLDPRIMAILDSLSDVESELRPSAE
jgi:hypothetical protein